jgi:hypothetical protein
MVGLRRIFVVVLAVALAFGIPSGALRASGSPGLPQVQAPGRPYSGDCSVVLPQADRMEKGLEVQKKAIERTEAQIAAAKGLTPPSPVEVGTPDQAKGLVSSLMAKGAELRTKIQALKLNPEQSASRDRLLKYFDGIDKLSTSVDVGLAAFKYKQAMVDVKNLQQLAEATSTYLSDSGLGDMLAGELGGRVLGETLGGPAGFLIFEASALAIEVGAREAEQEINASELQQAESTRDALKFQYDAMRERIAFMRQNCGPANSAQSKPPANPDPPQQASGKKSAKPSKPADGQRARGGSGKVVAAAAVAGGAAIGGLYAMNALRNAVNNNLGGGCDPSKAPINQINTYCFGSTRNTTLCNQYIAQYDSFCKSCGYSGFDTGTGGCR